MKQGFVVGLIVGLPIFIISLLISMQNNLLQDAFLRAVLVYLFVIGASLALHFIMTQFLSVEKKQGSELALQSTQTEVDKQSLEQEAEVEEEGKGGVIDFTTPDEQTELFQPLDVDKLRTKSE